MDDTNKNIKKKKSPKEKPYYVSSVEFAAEIRKYYETGTWTPYLADAIQNIAKGVAHRYNFIRYSWKDDMIATAIHNMVQAVNNKKCKLDGGLSCFGYFSTIAWNACLEIIRKETKNRDIIEEFQEMMYNDLLNSDLDPEHMVYVKQTLENKDKQKIKNAEKKKNAKTKEEYIIPRQVMTTPVK